MALQDWGQNSELSNFLLQIANAPIAGISIAEYVENLFLEKINANVKKSVCGECECCTKLKNALGKLENKKFYHNKKAEDIDHEDNMDHSDGIQILSEVVLNPGPFQSADETHIVSKKKSNRRFGPPKKSVKKLKPDAQKTGEVESSAATQTSPTKADKVIQTKAKISKAKQNQLDLKGQSSNQKNVSTPKVSNTLSNINSKESDVSSRKRKRSINKSAQNLTPRIQPDRSSKANPYYTIQIIEQDAVQNKREKSKLVCQKLDFTLDDARDDVTSHRAKKAKPVKREKLTEVIIGENKSKRNVTNKPQVNVKIDGKEYRVVGIEKSLPKGFLKKLSRTGALGGTAGPSFLKKHSLNLELLSQKEVPKRRTLYSPTKWMMSPEFSRLCF